MASAPATDGAEVNDLVAAGRMRPPGLAEVDAAKADGRWAAAYESQRNATVPPDLAEALDASPQARRAFEASNRTQHDAIFLKLATTRMAAGRAAQLRRIVAALAREHPGSEDGPPD